MPSDSLWLSSAGHLDKQPPFDGWEEGLSPYEPVSWRYSINHSIKCIHRLSISTLPRSFVVNACMVEEGLMMATVFSVPSQPFELFRHRSYRMRVT